MVGHLDQGPQTSIVEEDPWQSTAIFDDPDQPAVKHGPDDRRDLRLALVRPGGPLPQPEALVDGHCGAEAVHVLQTDQVAVLLGEDRGLCARSHHSSAAGLLPDRNLLKHWGSSATKYLTGQTFAPDRQASIGQVRVLRPILEPV